MDGAPGRSGWVRISNAGSVDEFFAHGFHLGEGVLVAGAVGGGDAGMEAFECGFGAAEFGEGLRGHLVGGDVVGGVGDEGGELGERGLGVAADGVFHGKAVTGEGVGGVQFEYFGESGELVHGLILVAHGIKADRGFARMNTD